MTRARISENGTLTLPRALREAVGLSPGAEVEISQSGGRLVVEPVPPAALEVEAGEGAKRLTVAEFLAQRIPYDGPPMTDEMMDKAILDEARRRWERVQRQLDEDLRD
ncbi:AbrB/MazE/SpoVT family DNA-binding domain-containing protein [Xaviernesmea oryzae]|nr:AbrB/MazE/SpoVT family DNA-binding domain-containing protein [Xaviernesmea oryzae]SEL55663.1 looped-hinge helix DNA binding domain-containing protein, AbrB family [Xaviernesmea oryzae]